MKFIEKSDILRQVSEHLVANELIKVTLGGYHGSDPDLKNIYIKPVVVKRKVKLSFTYRYQRRDIVKNYETNEALSIVLRYIEQEEFHSVSMFHTAENIFFQLHKKKGWSWRKERITDGAVRSLDHDKKKDRKLSDTPKMYLKELRLTDEHGMVYKNAQDKWKQINHYIEILSTTLNNLPAKECLRVVDMGAGKGYLTFALYDYMSHVLHHNTEIVGVEFRPDLVDLCNDIAKKSGFTGLSFVQGTIADYTTYQQIDVLIALHACDTATDDAIYKGIQNESELIIVAPCCHKQIRREIEKNKSKNDLDFMTRHGIFMERHAEMLTDSIRVLIMEYFGYQTKVLEFVSDAHTPKNVLLIGQKKPINIHRQAEIKQKIEAIHGYFGIGKHYLAQVALG